MAVKEKEHALELRGHNTLPSPCHTLLCHWGKSVKKNAALRQNWARPGLLVPLPGADEQRADHGLDGNHMLVGGAVMG